MRNNHKNIFKSAEEIASSLANLNKELTEKITLNKSEKKQLEQTGICSAKISWIEGWLPEKRIIYLFKTTKADKLGYIINFSKDSTDISTFLHKPNTLKILLANSIDKALLINLFTTYPDLKKQINSNSNLDYIKYIENEDKYKKLEQMREHTVAYRNTFLECSRNPLLKICDTKDYEDILLENADTLDCETYIDEELKKELLTTELYEKIIFYSSDSNNTFGIKRRYETSTININPKHEPKIILKQNKIQNYPELLDGGILAKTEYRRGNNSVNVNINSDYNLSSNPMKTKITLFSTDTDIQEISRTTNIDIKLDDIEKIKIGSIEAINPIDIKLFLTYGFLYLRLNRSFNIMDIAIQYENHELIKKLIEKYGYKISKLHISSLMKIAEFEQDISKTIVESMDEHANEIPESLLMAQSYTMLRNFFSKIKHPYNYKKIIEKYPSETINLCMTNAESCKKSIIDSGKIHANRTIAYTRVSGIADTDPEKFIDLFNSCPEIIITLLQVRERIPKIYDIESRISHIINHLITVNNIKILQALASKYVNINLYDYCSKENKDKLDSFNINDSYTLELSSNKKHEVITDKQTVPEENIQSILEKTIKIRGIIQNKIYKWEQLTKKPIRNRYYRSRRTKK